MNEFLKLEERGGRETVDARGLHAALGVARDFSTWIKDRIEKYGFQEGKDFSPNLGESTGGRPGIEYALTLSMAKELATVENNDAGRAIRRYLIQVEEAWNTPKMVMARAVQVADKEMEEMRGRIALLEPKAAFADAIDNSASGIPIGDFAHVLASKGWDIGRNRLFRILREKSILYVEYVPALKDSVSKPYQIQIENGNFVVNEMPALINKDKEEVIRPQALVTPKGQRFILDHLETWGFVKKARRTA